MGPAAQIRRGRLVQGAAGMGRGLLDTGVAVRALLVLLALALGAVGGRMLWTITAPGTVGWEARPLIAGNLPPGRMPQGYTALTEFDAFHRAVQSPEQETETAPETTLDLKLTGLRAAENGEGGSAIIRTPDHAQRAYGVGDEIVAGVRLGTIRPEAVVLSREGGRMETLYLDERARRRATIAAESAESALPIPERLMQLDDIQLAPRLENGRMTGIRLTAVGAATLLKRNGLISGDVLLAVNGIGITSPARAEAALRALKGAAQADLVIERNGEERTLTVALDG